MDAKHRHIGIPVILENVKTGEIKEFQSLYSLSKFFMEKYFIEISSENVRRIITQKKPYKKIWRVRYK